MWKGQEWKFNCACAWSAFPLSLVVIAFLMAGEDRSVKAEYCNQLKKAQYLTSKSYFEIQQIFKMRESGLQEICWL